MRNVFNFSPGPAMLPEEVLLQAQAEMLDWQGTGMSLMELGHRGDDFQRVAIKAEADIREIMAVPANYHILFLAGGATTQFSMVPLNLMGKNQTADYIQTGVWSKKAVVEAQRYGKINVAAETIYENGLAAVPPLATWKLNSRAAFVHYTPNETIDGLEFHWIPKVGNVPLVADMTSMILSRPINVTDFGIIYAGAQKNLGQAGLTVAIVRDDLIHDALPFTPTLYMYKTHAENGSLYNTPPTYAWYIFGLMMEWVKRQGGVDALYAVNLRKSEKLYQLIDESNGFYVNRVVPSDRSIMNVAFFMQDDSLTSTFLSEAEAAGLTNLRGHRVSGGVRASIYNGMPEQGVAILADFMIDFYRRNG